MPIFSICTLVGTFWLYVVVRDTPSCMPSETHLWFSGFWLLLSYGWLIVHIAVGVTAVILERRMRRSEHDLAAVSDGDVRARWGDVGRLSDYTALPREQGGLTAAEIKGLPGLGVFEDESNRSRLGCDCVCSVCLSGFEVGDPMRALEPCGHVFHRACIDLWLLRRADCPLCKHSVRGAC